MEIPKSLLKRFRVRPGANVRLSEYDPAWSGEDLVPGKSKAERKAAAEQLLAEGVAALAQAQELLYAADSWALLVIFQAMDAAGKDSTIKHVMTGINPQGCQVTPFKHPTAKELEHTFLWRCMLALPERGRIGIFNRSYYEEVLVVRVHPELVHAQRIPGANPRHRTFWEQRYDDINHFEQHLARNGTAIVKFFLHLSRQEQRKRFLQRLTDPTKFWKFNAADLAERAYWDDYMAAYEACLSATSTSWAPWYIIPADHKWVTRALVAAILAHTIHSLDLKWPEVSKEQQQAMEQARRQLEAEGAQDT